MKKEQSVLAHLVSILALPFNVTVLIPLLLLMFFDYRFLWGLSLPYTIILLMLGTISIIVGLGMLISTIAQFATRGKGTLAPWNPPQRLVITGLYRYTRNPMISGVVFVLIGEVVVAGSWLLLIWLLLFTTVNYIYFIVAEEPALEKSSAQIMWNIRKMCLAYSREESHGHLGKSKNLKNLFINQLIILVRWCQKFRIGFSFGRVTYFFIHKQEFI